MQTADIETMTDEARILLIHYIAATGAAARLLRGAALRWEQGDNRATLWSEAAQPFREAIDRLKIALKEMGHDLDAEPPDEEWPELMGDDEWLN